jgi:hypothetical protein
MLPRRCNMRVISALESHGTIAVVVIAGRIGASEPFTPKQSQKGH